jgi:multiple sugar transport system ATP-binding protein
MASVTIQAVKKRFGEVAILHGVDIDIADGSFTVLVGPSGCGKSTLLRMIAGLEEITAARSASASARVNDLPPKERDIAMVFQNYALYPHMTVRDNMAFALALAKQDKATIETKVQRAAEILGARAAARTLSAPAFGRPAPARGHGPRHRARPAGVPVRRAAVQPRRQAARAMRSEIKELHQRLKTTSIYVTHDQIEAMTMGDKIVVMRDGRIEQTGSPLDLYDHPANQFVAGFIGSPAMNFLPGTLRRAGGAAHVELPDGTRLDAPASGRRHRRPAGGVRHAARAPDARRQRWHSVEGRGDGADRHGHLRRLPPRGRRTLGVFRERHDFAPGSTIHRLPDLARAHLFDAAAACAWLPDFLLHTGPFTTKETAHE